MLTVREIMTKAVVVIRSSATVQDASLLMRAKQLRSLIVEKTETIPYGIVTEKDIVFKVIARRDNPDLVNVCDIMQQPCFSIAADATVPEAAQFLADKGIHRAPVIENDELLGIISVTDILRKGQPDVAPRDELAQRIQAALQQARIIDDEEAQMRQDCDLAWQIFEEMHQDSQVAR